MRDWKIRIEPFHFTDILKCNIRKTVNDHATAQVVCHISDQLEDQYVEMALKGVQTIIYARDDTSREKVVFNGLPRDLSIETKNNMKILTIELVSASYLMDNFAHTRTFQNAAMTYDDVLGFLGAGYENYGVVLTVGLGTPIKDIIVQYKETDWEFAKRLASHFNSMVIPVYHLDGINYCFGLPNRPSDVIAHPIEYTLQKAVGEYTFKKENKVSGLREADAIYYRVKDREIHELAQRVTFKDRELYIYEIQSELEGSELVHTYTLKSKEGFRTKYAYNEAMIGASLEGSILKIKQDMVKVHVHVDPEQDLETAKWFAYSTVYSSPDGTGWYAMPEEGDAVRLYLPNEKEADGYIISAVHLQPSNNQARTNPDFKSMRNKYDKEVLFTPGSLTFTNNKGMYIEILDDEGISIVSDKKITIIADNELAIASTEADISTTAPEGIFFEQNDTREIMHDDVYISGSQVVVQEP